MNRKVKHILTVTAGVTTLLAGFNNCGEVRFDAPTEVASKGSGVDCVVGETCDIPCTGSSCPNPEDVFLKQIHEVPYSKAAVDILFVIDNSGSMKKELQNLGSRFQQFSSALTGKNWQACLITTDWEAEAGAFRQWDNQTFVLNGDTQNFSQVFESTLNKITSESSSGSFYEHGIRSSYSAISKGFDTTAKNCFRKDSAKALVIVSDEDELGSGWTNPSGEQPHFENKPENLMNLVSTKFGSNTKFTAHAVAIKPGDTACLTQQRSESGSYEETFGFEAIRYKELVDLAKGEFVSICESDYSSSLIKIGEKIAQSLSSIELPCAKGASVRNVEVLSSSTTSRSFSVIGKTVSFNPVLVSGEKAIVHYKCLD